MTRAASATGFDRGIVWDASKPDGQPRRSVDVERTRQLFGFRAAHSRQERLPQTIAWFMTHRREQRLSLGVSSVS
jgi:GDP-L-fucose synthase